MGNNDNNIMQKIYTEQSIVTVKNKNTHGKNKITHAKNKNRHASISPVLPVIILYFLFFLIFVHNLTSSSSFANSASCDNVRH